jgi:hypothetical protein
MGRYIYLLIAIAALFATPAPSFADDLPLVIYPRIYNYPGQQLCQVDRNDRRYRELCAPQSYHPYGASGYRPYGTYRPYRSAQRFWVAPNARIVKINPENQ